jgi:hypothetical protein
MLRTRGSSDYRATHRIRAVDEVARAQFAVETEIARRSRRSAGDGSRPVTRSENRLGRLRVDNRHWVWFTDQGSNTAGSNLGAKNT